MQPVPGHSLLLRTIGLLYWVIATVTWWASLWHLDSYAGLQAALPAPARLLQAASEAGLPFAIAASFSAASLWLGLRRDTRALVASAWMLCIAIVLALLAMAAMTAPMLRLCGEVVPGWPGTSQPVAASAPTAAAPPSGKACRH